MIKIGQIGIGHNHSDKIEVLQRYPEHFQLVGYAEDNEEWIDRRGAKPEFANVKRMSVEEVLEKSDAILVETDVWDLTKTAQMCIDAGKHIHMDKPASGTLEEYKHLLDSAKEKNLVVQLGYMYRYNPAVCKLLEMYLAVQDVSSALTTFSKTVGRPAFLSALLETSDELKREGVLPEELMAAAEQQSGGRKARFADLALIYGAYQRRLEQGKLDPVDRLTRAAERLVECDWAEGKDFWVDGFESFTGQQTELLRALIGQAHDVHVALTCDRDGGQGENGVFAAEYAPVREFSRSRPPSITGSRSVHSTIGQLNLFSTSLIYAAFAKVRF